MAGPSCNCAATPSTRSKEGIELINLKVRKPKVRRKPEDKRRELRDRLWPGAEKVIWNRTTDDGWCTVPRTLPLIMTLINELAPKAKGDPSRVYCELWSRVFDEGFIEMEDETDHAFAAGFVTSRGVRTWRERMAALKDLGFIRVKPDGSRQYGYVLLVHPHDVVASLRKAGKVRDSWYYTFMDRIGKIGARPGKALKAVVGRGA